MNKQAIIKAILQGQAVYWKNTCYRVVSSSKGGEFMTWFVHNDSFCRLQPSEYQNCFMG